MNREVSADRLVANRMYNIVRSSGRVEATGLYTGKQQTGALSGSAPIFLVNGEEAAFGPWRYTYKIHRTPSVAPAAGGARKRTRRSSGHRRRITRRN
jgi:hypothetical protein